MWSNLWHADDARNGIEIVRIFADFLKVPQALACNICVKLQAKACGTSILLLKTILQTDCPIKYQIVRR
jgi:hypothetical protein